MSVAAIDVAVNLLWCVPGDVGGSEQYLVRQLVGLRSHPTEFAPTLYCLPAFVDAHPELAALYPMVAAGISGEQRPRRIIAEHTWLRRRTGSTQLVHHGGGTAPVGGHRPIVLTIHDLQYLTHPEYLSASKLRYLSWSIPRSVKPGDGHRRSDRVRATNGHRRVRNGAGPGRGRSPRRRTRTRR